MGGELAVGGDVLLDPLSRSARGYAIPSAAEDVEIVLGELGERAECSAPSRSSSMTQSLHARRPHGARRSPAVPTPALQRTSEEEHHA